MIKFSQIEYNWILSLQRRQKTMLNGKDESLLELYRLCDEDTQRNLIRDLLIKFDCFDDEIYNLALIEMSRFIINLNYPQDKVAIVALCHDSSADSSQAILDDIKVPLAKLSGFSYKTINRFDKIKKAYNQGYRHFIGIDEFTGSGSTIENRFNDFVRNNYNGSTINFCIMAGMSHTKEFIEKLNIPLYIAYLIKRGISDYYINEDLENNMRRMSDLEDKLAPKINLTDLKDYRMGYKQSESLFTRLNKNVPNNVFPVFWWKAYANEKKRLTLFDRVQNGY